MQKLIAVLQIKSDNREDFIIWLNWYTYFIKCDEIVIIDDNSQIDIKNICKPYNNIKYFNSSDIINNNFTENNKQCNNINWALQKVKVKLDDIVLIPDHDEFWWYDTNKFDSFKSCCEMYFNNYGNTFLVPWTCMYTNVLLYKRTTNLIDTFKYAILYNEIEHKPVVKFSEYLKYTFHNFNKTSKSITKLNEKYDYKSKFVFNLPIRCYHYRYTTESEYYIKISSTISNPNKPRLNYIKEFKDLHKYLLSNKLCLDLTMLVEYQKLLNNIKL